MLRSIFAALLLSGSLAAGQATHSSRSIVVESFDQTPAWNVTKGSTAVVQDLPAPADGPSGKVLHVAGDAKTFSYSKSDSLPKDLPAASAVSFWIKRKDQSPVTVELQFLENDGAAKYWRKIELKADGWQKVELPLRYMRWGGNRTPQWERIGRVGVLLREPGEVWIDQITLDFAADSAARPTPAQLAALAFPDSPPGAIRTAEWEDGRIITNSAKLDLKQLEAHLKKVIATLRADMPFLPPVKGFVPTLVVSDTDRQYRDFPPRWANQLDAQMDPPTSSGFTFMGLATVSWSDQYGTMRPTYTHEFIHAYLECSAGLSSGSGDWFQEGAASHYQLLFHPQADLARIVAAGLADPRANTPLKQLCSGQRVPLNRYWQARTIVQTLLSDKYKPKLEQTLALFTQTGSSDLGKALEPVYSTTYEALEKDWRETCTRLYPTTKPAE